MNGMVNFVMDDCRSVFQLNGDAMIFALMLDKTSETKRSTIQVHPVISQPDLQRVVEGVIKDVSGYTMVKDGSISRAYKYMKMCMSFY